MARAHRTAPATPRGAVRPAHIVGECELCDHERHVTRAVCVSRVRSRRRRDGARNTGTGKGTHRAAARRKHRPVRRF
eukprot:7389545-Prymnesium_polylepis.1